eukprot:6213585-Pleurochrysis_carterae.AAC.1
MQISDNYLDLAYVVVLDTKNMSDPDDSVRRVPSLHDCVCVNTMRSVCQLYASRRRRCPCVSLEA